MKKKIKTETEIEIEIAINDDNEKLCAYNCKHIILANDGDFCKLFNKTLKNDKKHVKITRCKNCLNLELENGKS